MNTSRLDRQLGEAISSFRSKVSNGETVAAATQAALEDFRSSIVSFLKSQD